MNVRISTPTRLREALTVHHGREITALASPIVLTMFSQTLMWTVDTMFLGHHSSLALGAAGLGGILLWTSYSAVNNLSRITGTFISQAHGKNDDSRVGDYAWQGMYMATFTGLVLMLLGMNARPLMDWTGIPPHVLDGAAVYMRWRALSAVFTQWGFALMGYFQGRRKVGVPMWAGIISNLANALLDWWFIFGWAGIEVAGHRFFEIPAMGLRGAALATSCGVALNTTIMFLAMFGSAEARRRYRIHVPRIPNLRKLKDIARVGAPSSVENFVDMSTLALFSTFIGRSGEIALAANQIQIQLLSFSFMPMWGLTTAGSVLTGNWLGASRPADASKYGRQVYKLGLYYCLSLGVLLVLFRHQVFRVFTPDPEVLAFGGVLAVLAAIFQVGDGMRMVGSGLLTGAGDTKPVMLITIGVMWGVMLPGSWWAIVRQGGDVTTAWAVASLSYMIQGVAFWLRFRSDSWQRVKIFSSAV